MVEPRLSNRADFRLSIDDQDLRGDDLLRTATRFLDLTDKVRPRLVSINLSEKRGGEADQLDIVLDDADGKLALPRKRALVRLQLGWESGAGVPVGLVDKGRFTVDDIEWGGPPDRITIRARSADLTADFRTRREASHTGTSLGAIAREIAARAGLEPRIAPELASIPVPVRVQHHTSDMAFLRRLGREHDAVATVKDRTLILAPIGRGATTSGKSLPLLELRRSDCARYSFKEIERSADAGVEARWHDTLTGDRRTVRAGGTGAGTGTGTPRRLRKVYHSEADARRAAEARAQAARRAEAEFSTTLALGRPDLYPERPVALIGFKPPIDARRWLIAELTHTLDERGLATGLKLETAS